ncbi:Type II secretion system protein D precursor [Pseudomonas oleovorans subsp. oleovorans]|uniref:General secretion pathway protein D n=1 Tax=Ectopseudomonas oleovorans TaxID=301 RepID=A0A379JMM1_ECTOL|nr:Type II secretion system protein D precursor [Pseudomonas oleovorans subsp. oleovorans]SEJ83872.1 general secretion pathway protein D [Pseudomonas oleovorans]SUD49670.1 general secretion pathway protein D [Pseudomonas oleovorans]
MNVGGVFLDRFTQDGVDQADDRRIVLLLQQVFGFRHLIGQRGQIETAADVLGQLHGSGIVLIGRTQHLGELRRTQHLQRQRRQRRPGRVNFAGTGLSVGSVLQILQSDEIPEDLTLPDGAIIGIGSDRFGALITALSANSKSNLLSTPSLLTLDNQKAEILVGQNVPFQTGSYTTDASGAGNPFTTIERQDIGVTLKVTPSINEGATLRLEIEQEISSIAPSTGRNAQAVDLVTNKLSIKSIILADDGQVIVLGGLIQDDVTQAISKVPLLGDIPLLGGLFRSTRESHIKRNLMVFLRPTIVRDGAGLAALSGKKYSDIRIIGNGGPDNGRPSILPSTPSQLFDGQGAPAVDLRQ